MKKQNKTGLIDLEKVRKWVSNISPYFIAIRPPEVFEEMGFTIDIVRKCVRKYRHLRLNNGRIGNTSGVSDADLLALLAKGIGADCLQGDRMLCKSNKIRA
jgi:hypothetical protein